MWCNRLLLCQN